MKENWADRQGVWNVTYFEHVLLQRERCLQWRVGEEREVRLLRSVLMKKLSSVIDRVIRSYDKLSYYIIDKTAIIEVRHHFCLLLVVLQNWGRKSNWICLA